jgi:hypothetical protein
VIVTVNAASVDTTSLVAEYTFEDGTAADSSPNGQDNSGTLGGNATVVTDASRGQVLHLDGDGDHVNVADSQDINLSTVTNRTISLWFNADTTSGRQVLYEEGGGTRGINVYIDDGQLYVGIWGMTGAANVFLSTGIAAGQWNNVSLVLDSSTGTFTAYLNGTSFGSAAAGTLRRHSGDIGIGRVDGKTKFHDGNSTRGVAYNFAGLLDDLLIYNRALSLVEITRLSDDPGA